MIPKAEVLAVAGESGLLPTTVEKDYVLGWVLFAISEHPVLARWHFKGGTCLKKCYFDTYRFSEDLDFTIPGEAPYDDESVRDGLLAIAEWVRDRSGLEFPGDTVDVTQSVNKRGYRTYQARMTFVGPLNLARAQRQRIRFDLTQDEVILETDRIARGVPRVFGRSGSSSTRPLLHASGDPGGKDPRAGGALRSSTRRLRCGQRRQKSPGGVATRAHRRVGRG